LCVTDRSVSLILSFQDELFGSFRRSFLFVCSIFTSDRSTFASAFSFASSVSSFNQWDGGSWNWCWTDSHHNHNHCDSNRYGYSNCNCFATVAYHQSQYSQYKSQSQYHTRHTRRRSVLSYDTSHFESHPQRSWKDNSNWNHNGNGYQHCYWNYWNWNSSNERWYVTVLLFSYTSSGIESFPVSQLQFQFQLQFEFEFESKSNSNPSSYD